VEPENETALPPNVFVLTKGSDRLQLTFDKLDDDNVPQTGNKGTFTYSNSEPGGKCEYTNPDGEKLSFETAEGTFTYSAKTKGKGKNNGPRVTIDWFLPVGHDQPTVRHTHRVTFAVAPLLGTFEAREEEDEGEEE